MFNGNTTLEQAVIAAGERLAGFLDLLLPASAQVQNSRADGFEVCIKLFGYVFATCHYTPLIASVDPANLKILLMDYDNFIAASIRRRLSECRCRCLEAIYLHPVWRTGHWSPHRLTD